MLRPVVAREQHQRVVADANCLEGLKESAEGGVHLREATIIHTRGRSVRQPPRARTSTNVNRSGKPLQRRTTGSASVAARLNCAQVTPRCADVMIASVGVPALKTAR